MGAILLLVCLQLRPVEAQSVLIQIEGLMAWLNGDPTIQFIELTRLEGAAACVGTGITFIAPPTCAATGIGARLVFFDAAGTQTAEFIFPGNAPFGEARRSILVGTQAFANLGLMPPDFMIPHFAVPDSGKVCYKKNVPGTPFIENACPSYGHFTGSTEGFGTPAAILPITGNFSLKRVGKQDRFNNSTDFALSTPDPRNNVTPLPQLLAAVLPSSRSVQFGVPTTAFATIINAGGTPTFSVFVKGGGTVRFSPATNRIFVRFKDAEGMTRGVTSVAVETQTK